MPQTIGGLIVIAVFLTPGFLNYIQRKGRAPLPSLSPLVETATFVSISVATNLAAVGVFCLVRVIVPSHTPNVELLRISRIEIRRSKNWLRRVVDTWIVGSIKSPRGSCGAVAGSPEQTGYANNC